MSLIPDLDKWQFSSEYQTQVDIGLDKFVQVTNLLLENPNLNSSHLFRADILSDSAHILKTNAEKEAEYYATRLHRTFLSLLRTFVRLAKGGQQPQPQPQPDQAINSSRNRSQPVSLATQLKDTILPRHVVQNTYSRLKSKYATDLISRWVEKTEPSKHVFEDLLIAAFLIELWKSMYGGGGSCDTLSTGVHAAAAATRFTGFVDVACGNGILVYVLIREGYQGFGLDARRRKTWDILGIDAHLREQVIVPKPFLDVLQQEEEDAGTFIISNHADELTAWTPILAALSSPLSPLPFVAIPCSAAVSPPPSSSSQSQSGDLRALRADKAKAAAHVDDKSTYACLTRKVVDIATTCGNRPVEMTLLRIPSTRNIGVVGNHRDGSGGPGREKEKNDYDDDAQQRRILDVIKRECAVSGGLKGSAEMWMVRTRRLQLGQGRGKVNLGYNKHKPGSNQ
ncbi:hypothetical protein DV735_g2049, partial [Chaetothyriales sp. CBS 134920]